MRHGRERAESAPAVRVVLAFIVLVAGLGISAASATSADELASCGASVTSLDRAQPQTCGVSFVVPGRTEAIFSLQPPPQRFKDGPVLDFTGRGVASLQKVDEADSPPTEPIELDARFVAGRAVAGTHARPVSLEPGTWELQLVVGSSVGLRTPGLPPGCLVGARPCFVPFPGVPSRSVSFGTSHGTLNSIVRPL